MSRITTPTEAERIWNDANAEPKLPDYKAVRMLGRLRDGCERDGGVRYHALDLNRKGGRALCGARPGQRSVGWADHPDAMREVSETTCPRCLSKFKREADRLGAIGLIDRADDLRLALRSTVK